MHHGFTNKLLQTTSCDGRNFHLLEFLEYTDSRGRRYRTATSTDGGSTPWCLWWLIPPFGKKDWFSFILHDGCYRNSIEIWNFGRWIKWTPNEAVSNWLLRDAMRSQHYSPFRRAGVYIALKYFGWRAFDEDRRMMRGVRKFDL